MTRLVRGGALLLSVAALIVACASPKETDKRADVRDAPRQDVELKREADTQERQAAGARNAPNQNAPKASAAIENVMVLRGQIRAVAEDAARPAAMAVQSVPASVSSMCCPPPAYKQPDEYGAVWSSRRQPCPLGRRASRFDILDRRGYRRVCQCASLPERGPAAAAGCGASRRDDQLLRLRVPTLRQRRESTVSSRNRACRRTVESEDAAAAKSASKALKSPPKDRPPANLVFLIDVSGSMQTSGQAAAAEECVPLADRSAHRARSCIHGGLCRQLGRRARADCRRSEAQDPRSHRPPGSRRLDERRRRHSAGVSAGARRRT